MHTLVELAQSRRDTARKQLAGLLAESRSQRDKLGLLESYQQDYQARLSTGLRQGMDAPVLANFRQFMAQLEQAVQQQGAAVAGSQCRLEHGRDAWHESERRLQTFELLLSRRTAAQQRLNERRIQSGHDEIAARIATRLSNGTAER